MITVLVGSSSDEVVYAHHSTEHYYYETYRFWPFRQTISRRYSRSLVGATFPVRGRRGATLEISAAGPDSEPNGMSDPDYTSNADVYLYTLSVIDGPGRPKPVCPEGGPGLFVKGHWDEDGAYSDEGLTFACSGHGVVAKCVQQWGYKPWKSLPNPYFMTMVDLKPLFLSCTRAAMADYCGDGVSHTIQNGLVDLFDFYGFNTQADDQALADFINQDPETKAYVESIYMTTDLDLIFESMFASNGTVAHHHKRYSALDEQTLTCDTFAVPLKADESEMWDAANVLANGNAVVWDKKGYVATRSHPRVWPYYADDDNMITELINEQPFTCPYWWDDSLFCPN
jgi:hypothetical protein